MEVTLEQFRKNASERGICEMSADWDKCKSKKQLIDLALSIRGIEYIAKAISEGWGIDADTICREFAPFINGKYVREKDGYTSALYCSLGDKKFPLPIDATQTAILVIRHTGTIYIPKNRICEIHLVDSDSVIYGEGKAKVYSYGSTVHYDMNVKCDVTLVKKPRP